MSDSLVAQLLIAVVIFTTIQAQDFKDVDGDVLINRQTLPILLPTASRLGTSLLVPLWSLFFVYCYRTANPVVSAAAVVLGAITGTRFWFERTRDSDKMSYLLYNVSLTTRVGYVGKAVADVRSSSSCGYVSCTSCPSPLDLEPHSSESLARL